MQSKTIGIAIVTLVIGVAIGYFFPHSAATKTKTPSGFAGSATGNTQFARGSFTARGSSSAYGGALIGIVVSVSGQDLTVKTPDGSSHVVVLTPETRVTKSVTGSTSDLTGGANVLVSGTTNSDGSISASVIQLPPAGAQIRTGTQTNPTQGSTQ